MRIAILTLRFLRREIGNRFAGSLWGAQWALLQPLLQLAVTSFVFMHVFKARVPGADAPGYLPFLAVAFWPWTAFAEALLRSTTVIQDNTALIGKVALPREALVVASVLSSFAIHAVGYVVVLLALAVFGYDIRLAHLWQALPLYFLLLVLALGAALFCAAIQVFVRDLVQILGQTLPLLMFTAPVYYPRDLLPERFRGWIDWNPFTFYAEAFRGVLLDYGDVSLWRMGAAALIALLALIAGHSVFRRLDSHFEDFL